MKNCVRNFAEEAGVEAHSSKPGYEEKVREHAENGEMYISQHSQALGLKMVKCIYGGPEAVGAERKRPRKRPS